jgi:SET domain-containing protein
MLYITKSKIHGRGVFTKEFIPKDTLIEKIPFIEFNRDNIIEEFKDYTFGISRSTVCLMLSYSSFLNHSDNPNAIIRPNPNEKFLYLHSIEEIKKDEEITIKYGENIIFS